MSVACQTDEAAAFSDSFVRDMVMPVNPEFRRDVVEHRLEAFSLRFAVGQLALPRVR
jgi:hypothetical protein